MIREAAGSSPAGSAKLYGVTRRDLSTGLRAAQVGHALIAWTVAYGPPPENLVLLEVEDEQALYDLAEAVEIQGHGLVRFHEPDLDGELTAFAVDSGAYRYLSSLPLAFREAKDDRRSL